jgi:hypothetical protein
MLDSFMSIGMRDDRATWLTHGRHGLPFMIDPR